LSVDQITVHPLFDRKDKIGDINTIWVEPDAAIEGLQTLTTSQRRNPALLT
jgi:hypothetical protein